MPHNPSASHHAAAGDNHLWSCLVVDCLALLRTCNHPKSFKFKWTSLLYITLNVRIKVPRVLHINVCRLLSHRTVCKNRRLPLDLPILFGMHEDMKNLLGPLKRERRDQKCSSGLLNSSNLGEHDIYRVLLWMQPVTVG